MMVHIINLGFRKQTILVKIILLAAGQSTRLGQAKQLLRWQDKPLIEYLIEQAKASKALEIITVLGAFFKDIQPVIPSDVTVVFNEDWQSGMSSSLQKGLALAGDSTGILVLLSDQPFVSTALINQIIDLAEQTTLPIIATQYAGTLGVPAFFKQSIFKDIQSLKAQQGAKKLIIDNAQKGQVAIVDFADGHIDIDTMQDYTAALRKAEFIHDSI